MNLYRKLFGRFQAPADDDGGDLPGTVDRGDDIQEPVAPEPAAAEPAPEAEPEAAAEPEAEPEPEVEPEPAPESEKPAKHKQTANERVREVIEKSKAREAEYQAKIRSLEAAQATGKLAEDFQAAEAKLGEMEAQYAQLLLDGEAKEAAKLRGEMRQLERAVLNEQSRQEVSAAKESVKEELQYDRTIASLERDYPQIDPDSDAYDNDAVTEILDLHKGLMLQGLPASMAIGRAVKYVLGSTVKTETEAPAATDKGLQRTKEAKVRNADAAQKQPASTSKVGFDSDKAGGPGPDAMI